MKPNHVMLITLASLAVLVPLCNSWMYKEVDECADNPCQNGAVCEDLIYDYICVCPNGYIGKKCETVLLSQYQLDFVNPSIMDYAELTIDQPLNTVSVSLWLRTTDKANQGTPFSYAVLDEPNALTFSDYQSPSLYINGEVTSIYTGQRTLNDGRWHHVVLIWSSVRGDWKVYVDGVTADQGFDLSTAKPIPGKGKFIVGQEQDLFGGGFSSSETFIGTLTHLNVWDRELSWSEIENVMFDCEGVHEGNVIAWPDFQEALEGDIRATPSSFCVECPTPENPENGQVSYSSTKTGSFAVFSCDIGYFLGGKPDYKCLITGMWDGTLPQCYAITCRPPGFIRNGYYTGHHFPYGSQIDFQCNPGYELDGPDRLTCTEWGNFDGDPPECVEIKCTMPPLSENTLASTSGTRFRPGTRVDFTCRPGSSMQTKHNSMVCQEDGSWDRSVPSCDPKCGYPPFIANGEPFTVVSEYNVGDISRYQCDFGYEFDPEASNSRGAINCLPSGDWATDLPVCRPITCPDPPSLPNTVQHGANHTFMSVVNFTCVVGFEPQGTSEIECHENGTWSEPSFRCTVLDCGEPPNLTSGSLHYQENLNRPMAKDTLFNSTVSYQCDQGYILAGDDTRRCQEDGKWSGSDPFCEPMLCEDLSDVPNGHVDYTNKTYLSKAKYTCDRGFELDGFSELICGASGQWSPNPPTCEPRSCPVPHAIQFGGYIVSGPFVYNTSLEYVCLTGYELIGTRRSVCQEEGTWSEPPPKCQHVYRPKLQDLKDATSVTTDWQTSNTTTTTAPTTSVQRYYQCHVDSVDLAIPVSVVPNSKLHLKESSCQLQNNGTHHVLSFGYHECGTSVAYYTDYIYATNDITVESTLPPNGLVVFADDYTIPLECRFHHEQFVNGAFQAVAIDSTILGRRGGADAADFILREFRTELYQDVITEYPAQIPLNKELFVEISLANANGGTTGIVVKECKATPSNDDNDNTTYTLIQDGCPAQPTVQLQPNPHNEIFRFSLQAFHFADPINQNNMVYLHCDVSICPVTSCTSNCAATKRRRRRSIAQLVDTVTVSSGPYLLV